METSATPQEAAERYQAFRARRTATPAAAPILAEDVKRICRESEESSQKLAEAMNRLLEMTQQNTHKLVDLLEQEEAAERARQARLARRARGSFWRRIFCLGEPQQVENPVAPAL